MESHCLFRVGLSSLIKSISKIRQSNLFWHFLEMLKQRSVSTGAILCCSLRWLPFVGPLCSSIRWLSYTENYTQRQPSQRAAQYGPRWYHASIVFCRGNLVQIYQNCFTKGINTWSSSPISSSWLKYAVTWTWPSTSSTDSTSAGRALWYE